MGSEDSHLAPIFEQLEGVTLAETVLVPRPPGLVPALGAHGVFVPDVPDLLDREGVHEPRVVDEVLWGAIFDHKEFLELPEVPFGKVPYFAPAPESV